MRGAGSDEYGLRLRRLDVSELDELEDTARKVTGRLKAGDLVRE